MVRTVKAANQGSSKPVAGFRLKALIMFRATLNIIDSGDAGRVSAVPTVPKPSKG
jgi:hypothetical protein